MAGERQIKRRIKSAGNISQITKAMQMVAASRMRKAQEITISGKPYREKIYQTVFKLAQGIDRKLHPLLKEEVDPKANILNILVSTNKGLCGGLNTNLFRTVQQWYPEKNNIDYITMGRKGELFVVRTGRKLVADFSADNLLKDVPATTSFLVNGFLSGQYKEVNIIFSEFINSLKQQPARRRILPIGVLTESEDSDEKINENKDLKEFFLIEPSASELLDILLPHYLEIQVRNAILEAVASEFSARMIAMKNATDNAHSLISHLTLEYNQLRQQRITYEIADIVTARIGIN